ncbi:hypothetical protein [uncultured Gammaproteobacteria bacterium]|nr:hypothetical protein [uncultured Gammaproteobacteria bacterium]
MLLKMIMTYQNLPPHRWLRNKGKNYQKPKIDLPPHRWLRNPKNHALDSV